MSKQVQRFDDTLVFPEIKFLLGSEETFRRFLFNIHEDDRIAIIAHNDLDGLCAGALMEQTLNDMFLFPKVRIFTDYGRKGVFNEVLEQLKVEKIEVVFMLDMNIDNYDPENFMSLRKGYKTLLIDHHPANPELKDTSDIIKTETYNCAAFLTYFLARGIINSMEKWALLVCAAMISDASFKRKENAEFISRIFPGAVPSNYRESEPGKLCGKVSAGLSLLDAGKVYRMVMDHDLAALTEIEKKVQGDIDRCVEYYKKYSVYFLANKLHYGVVDPITPRIASFIANRLSNEQPDDTFIIVCFDGDQAKVSARNQSCKVNMNELMKHGIEGLKEASGGGHAPASGACFRKKDLDKFIRAILAEFHGKDNPC